MTDKAGTPGTPDKIDIGDRTDVYALTGTRSAALAPPPAYAELHASSAFSFLRAASTPEALVARAADLGLPALALCDRMTLAGAPRFQAACARRGLRSLVGVELAVAGPAVFGDRADPAILVALAEDADGYARLCRLLSDANLADPRRPVVPWDALAAQPQGLILLTGGREGALARLVLAGRTTQAVAVATIYREAFGPDRVFVEVQRHRLPDDPWLLDRLAGASGVADQAGLRAVATNGVRHATREDLAALDALACARLGLTVDEAHAERPRNDEARLKGHTDLGRLFARFPWGRAAVAVAGEVAARCDLALLRGSCTAPRVDLPAGVSPADRLRALCEQGLIARYGTSTLQAGHDAPGACRAGGTLDARAALAPDSPQRAQLAQLAHELAVIGRLGLEEFFLCVHEIMATARDVLHLRVSGRGSAANSLVAYLLFITGTDPLRHGLLFERFLNPDRAGMPDIDVDVQSDRRDELIRHVERAYGTDHAAMVANVVTYRPRLAVREVAKALGYPQELLTRLTTLLPHHLDVEDLPGCAEELRRTLTAELPEGPVRMRCLERLPRLLAVAARLVGLPRHLSLHNGGLVLSREPLARTLAVRVSANGVRALEVDKDDVERLGLIKFDLLGLRTLGAVEGALDLIQDTIGARPDVDRLPLDPPDPATMRLIRAGQTLAVFQIESPGQWHLLAKTQPRTFDDLIVQTALFRPGPIQGGFVRPYVERRLAEHDGQPLLEVGGRQDLHPQRAAVQTPWRDAPADDFWVAHPTLGPILAESGGILLFQEQILEVAHRFAGLSYAEADGFRRAMSHHRSRREMEAMRGRFVAGALARGEREADAARVFEAISMFVGYGFCKSHAAEFARTIYQTAWLKAHYPAHYLSAFLSAQPAGYFPPHVVLEEAKRLGIPVLPVDVNRSEDRFSVERLPSVARRPYRSGNAGEGASASNGEGRWAIRIGLRQVAQIGDELARALLWERRGAHAHEVGQGDIDGQHDEPERPFASLWDLCARLRPAGLTQRQAEALVWSGACDGLAPRMGRRERLWRLREAWPLVDPGKPKGARAGGRKRAGSTLIAADEGERARPKQLAFSWELTLERPGELPALPTLTAPERDALDYETLGLSARPHPMRHHRRALDRRGVTRIANLADVPEGRTVRVAGWPISAQRPPTAHGMGFLVLEDETGRLPVALPPHLAEGMRRALRDARYLVVAGRLERVRWYRSILATDLLGERTSAPHRGVVHRAHGAA